MAATARGCAGAMLAVGALSASMAVPRSLSEPPLLPSLDRVIPDPPSCGVSLACPTRREEEARQVRALLASRIPGLAERDRVQLAAAILEESGCAGLDPLFVLAVIEVESAYEPDALSRRGARGLMQLRPSTMRAEAARSSLSAGDPSDPVLNVRMGVRYYARLLRIFGSQDLALMAYNAGPRRITGHLRSGGVPDRLRAYPRRVHVELDRLQKALAARPAALAAAGEGGPPVE